MISIWYWSWCNLPINTSRTPSIFMSKGFNDSTLTTEDKHWMPGFSIELYHYIFPICCTHTHNTLSLETSILSQVRRGRKKATGLRSVQKNDDRGSEAQTKNLTISLCKCQGRESHPIKKKPQLKSWRSLVKKRNWDYGRSVGDGSLRLMLKIFDALLKIDDLFFFFCSQIFLLGFLLLSKVAECRRALRRIFLSYEVTPSGGFSKGISFKIPLIQV